MAPEAKAYHHWRLEQDSDDIVWLTFDRAESSVNSLSRESLEELADLVKEVHRRKPAGVVFRSGKENGFIAGADVTEFTGLTGSDQALTLIERGQTILGQIEALGVPTIALINGFCLGGGLELALACRYRIAADSPSTRLGLPEVKLGIHPGFGGTVRLTLLVGPLIALELMLTGRSIDARQARAIGLVDYAVPERHLENAARATIRHVPSPAAPGLFRTFPGIWFMRLFLAAYLRRKVAKRTNENHYPAPFAVIDLWERFGGDPPGMFAEEARSVARLITGSTARNLIRVFLLQERLKSIGRQYSFAPRHVHVIGGGTMGGDIAAWCAQQGLRVTVQDVDHKRLAGVIARGARLFRHNLRDPRRVEAALDRLIPDLRGDGLPRADIVIEAIIEDVAAKQQLYRQIEPRLKPDAFIATNTSSIPLEELAGALAQPDRLVGLHFFNPVAKMQLVEVVRGSATAAETFARATAFAGTIGRLPLPVASSPGFLVNRILMPYLMEAVIMEAEGIPAAAIDRAAVEFGMPVGPLSLADTVGLDICLAVAGIIAGRFGSEVPQRLVALVSAGHLGKKTGRGFYAYAGDKPVVAGKKEKGLEGNELEVRLVLRLLNETVACLREQVVTDEDLLDAGVIFGTGFAPFRGGPLQHIRGEGVVQLHGRLLELEKHHGKRFSPDAGWQELLREEAGAP